MERQPGFPRQYGPSRSDHQPGIPFFPQETARDFVLIFLLTLPFIVLGREAPPAKSPVRSAFGVAFLLAWIFSASLYSIREVVAQRWQTPNGSPLINDTAMKWFFVIPPVLVGLTSYIGLRRLGYQPMRKWLFPYVAGLTAIVVVQAAGIFLIPGWPGPEVRPDVFRLGIFLMVRF